MTEIINTSATESPVETIETAETENQQTSEPIRSQTPRPLFGHKFGVMDMISSSLVIAGITANQFITVSWLRWAIRI